MVRPSEAVVRTNFSIPAQREANKKKAALLGALVVKEFVDRGASARSADRPELQHMLEYIEENKNRIDYVIVHKIDRLARNRGDDIDITRSLQRASVKLVSTTESIDESPSGMLLHGIMSSIAEFYSRNLSNEVIKGLSQKAKNGGTNYHAPLGYKNIRIMMIQPPNSLRKRLIWNVRRINWDESKRNYFKLIMPMPFRWI
jgi:site-specific DNA recombinase